MKYLALLAMSLTLIGCASSNASNAHSNAPKSEPLVIKIQNGNLEAKGWTLTVDDLPELVKAWHPQSVIIKGLSSDSLEPNFTLATQVKNALQAAGVADVTIDKASN